MQIQKAPLATNYNWPDRLYFRIREVAHIVGVRPSVLRYWQTEFVQIRPKKSSAGHRVYSRADVETALLIKRLLYEERYSIEGAKKQIMFLKNQQEQSDVLCEVISEGIKHEKLHQIAMRLRELMQLSVQDLFVF